MTAAKDTPRSSRPAAPDSETASDLAMLLDNARSIAPVIREHAPAAERERRVAKPVLEALERGGFQRMLAPRSLGGLELDPASCARVVEEIAGSDSAAAWSLQSGNVNAWFACRMSDEGVEELYGKNPSRMVAAAFHPPQQAVEVDGGYSVSGRGPLASMIHDAEWAVFSAMIMDNGQPRMTEHGPVMIVVTMPVSDVAIVDTWHTLGMRGTDSNDAAFKDVFVPARLAFPLNPDFRPGKHFQGPLYRMPTVPIVSLFSASVLLASARGAINELKDLAAKKVPMGSLKTLRDRGVAQATLAEAEAMLRSARAMFYQGLSDAWARCLAGQPHTLEHRADLLLGGIHAVQTSAKVTDMMHRLAGTTGIYTRSPIERYFRDTHTLRHHGFASESKLETVGQVYLGLPPDFPLIFF